MTDPRRRCGVSGYGGRLDIRPEYQREFVYKEKDRDAVIRSDRTLFERLNLRAFDPDDMRVAYENQKGICPICKGKFALEEMRGDHIKP